MTNKKFCIDSEVELGVETQVKFSTSTLIKVLQRNYTEEIPSGGHC